MAKKSFGAAVPPAVNDAFVLANARKILADKGRVKAAAKFEASRISKKKPVKKAKRK